MIAVNKIHWRCETAGEYYRIIGRIELIDGAYEEARVIPKYEFSQFQHPQEVIEVIFERLTYKISEALK